MIGEAIQSDTLKALASQQAIREAVVGRVAGENSKWTLSILQGGPTRRLVPVRSRREPLRTWPSRRRWAALPKRWVSLGSV